MPSVLIVEDDLTISDLLEEALEAEGFSVTGVARTLNEAVASAMRDRPDLAVIDIRLAKGDSGTDVAVYLRETTKARILFSTGNSNDLLVMEACGDAVMAKPYSMNDIGRALRIIDQLGQTGQTTIAFPRNFRLLAPVTA